MIDTLRNYEGDIFSYGKSLFYSFLPIIKYRRFAQMLLVCEGIKFGMIRSATPTFLMLSKIRDYVELLTS